MNNRLMKANNTTIPKIYIIATFFGDGDTVGVAGKALATKITKVRCLENDELSALTPR
jgi:hypothetical protein